jgi:hypothetical protein
MVDTVLMEKAHLARVAISAVLKTETLTDFNAKMEAATSAMIVMDARMRDTGAMAEGGAARAEAIQRLKGLFYHMMETARQHGEALAELQALDNMIKKLFPAAAPAAGGKRRKMSRKYCKKTTCKKMGFSQKASCRPYKNCFTRRTTQGGRQKGY